MFGFFSCLFVCWFCFVVLVVVLFWGFVLFGGAFFQVMGEKNVFRLKKQGRVESGPVQRTVSLFADSSLLLQKPRERLLAAKRKNKRNKKENII